MILRAGEVAVWDRGTSSMYCVECPAEAQVPEVAQPDSGVAGHSARAKYDRLHTQREAEIDARWGRVSRVVKALTIEPQSIRAWGVGARGEELLGEALAAVPGVSVLHDRRVRGTRGNIDHIVIAPAGVFVVDAKYLEGLIEIRNRGWLFNPDWRLTVGRRDKSKLATAMGWQVEAVQAALRGAGVDPLPPVTPALCFVEGEWPIFRPPEEYRGVRLESERSIRKLFSASEVLDPAGIERVTRALALAFPPK
jgi:hypothetical protein